MLVSYYDQAYTRSLKFDSKPDVLYLRKLFRDLYIAQGYGTSASRTWDWGNHEEDYLTEAAPAAAGDFKEDDDMAVDDGMDPNIMEVSNQFACYANHDNDSMNPWGMACRDLILVRRLHPE